MVWFNWVEINQIWNYMKKVLVSYATKAYLPAAELMRYSGMTVGGFDKCVVYTPDTIKERVGHEQHGSYAWKAAAIRAAFFEECQDGDLLVWADSTIQFLKCFKIDSHSPIILFRIGDAEEKGYTIQKYTKPECLEAMDVSSDEMEQTQVNAALQAYSKTPIARDFIETYYGLSQDDKCVGHSPRYLHHRHDQSILSILAQRWEGVKLHEDITQYGRSEPSVDHHRKVMKAMQTIVVVTPTTGKDIPALQRCMDSVQEQRVVCLRHLIVCDGPDSVQLTAALKARYIHGKVPITWLDLPYNTGANGWNGHRIYGCAPYLSQSAHEAGPAQMISYLDEDNWFESGHLEGLLDCLLDAKCDAVHSLRKIWQDGKFVCDDNCESLGCLTCSSEGHYFLADTSTWLIKQSVAAKVSHAWNVVARHHSKPEADRVLTSMLMSNFDVRVCRQHTLNYSAGSGRLSVKPEYFLNGNKVNQWNFTDRPDLYLFHMSQQMTDRFFETRFDTSKSYLLDEWNMNQCRRLSSYFNVINGYRCLPHIPRQAAVLIHMCIPEQLPLKFLQKRVDLLRILYTAESPNIRHSQQWETTFVASIADVVLTYWAPFLTNTSVKTYHCPHNCHHFDENNPHDRDNFKMNTGVPGTICMVLENRKGLEMYNVNGHALQCLDGMRQVWAGRLGEQKNLNMTVHGQGWMANGAWTVGGTHGKFSDSRHSVEILSEHSAALIVENCDAEGYHSEKVWDALMAGAVPIFFNSHETDLPNEIYFNLATCSLSDITPESISHKRKAVYSLREHLLQTVSSTSYADLIKRVISDRWTDVKASKIFCSA